VTAGATPERLLALSAVAGPDGLVHVREAVPAADLLTVAVDERLDEDGYIVPGLGDAGDRAFGTK
jgi:uracil phosphoribosyltransferase